MCACDCQGVTVNSRPAAQDGLRSRKGVGGFLHAWPSPAPPKSDFAEPATSSFDSGWPIRPLTRLRCRIEERFSHDEQAVNQLDPKTAPATTLSSSEGNPEFSVRLLGSVAQILGTWAGLQGCECPGRQGIRNGIKTISNWPPLPAYIKGEFVAAATSSSPRDSGRRAQHCWTRRASPYDKQNAPKLPTTESARQSAIAELPMPT